MNISPTQRREDKGFTLIELMVVVLIIAILLAIAIPTFLGAQNKAKDRSAQSSARNALTNAKTIFADTGKYSDVTIAQARRQRACSDLPSGRFHHSQASVSLRPHQPRDRLVRRCEVRHGHMLLHLGLGHRGSERKGHPVRQVHSSGRALHGSFGSGCRGRHPGHVHR